MAVKKERKEVYVVDRTEEWMSYGKKERMKYGDKSD